MRRRVAHDRARQTAAALIVSLTGSVDADPLGELLRMVTAAAAAERAYAMLLEDRGEPLAMVDYGKAGGTREEPHPYLKLWNEERDRLAKFAKLALDAGVEARQVRIAQEQAATIAGALLSVVDRLGLDDGKRTEARLLIATELRALA